MAPVPAYTSLALPRAANLVRNIEPKDIPVTDASATAARRPGEQALTTLGLNAPALDPADASQHSFPDGGRWRT